MAPIVVPGVCRYAMHQSLGGQPVVNIVDMQVDTTGSVVSRADGIEEIARDLLNNWADHMLFLQTDDLTFLSVSWVDLDSLSGSVGEVTNSSTKNLPLNGGQTTGDPMPAMVALRVDKQTAGGRGSKRGRMYLAGLREAETPAGVTQTWGSTTINGFNIELAAFLDGINDQSALTEDVQRQMVVVHTVNGVSSYTEVTGLSANPAISTQVRRGTLR